jgi:hypothetical protein
MKKVISPISGQSKYLLIENSEIVSEVAVSKDLKESLKLSAGKAGTLIVKNLPGTILNRENQNGRIYSTEVLAQAIKEARPLFETKQLLSQACEHPEGSFVSPTTASHVVTNAYIKKNVNLIVDGEQGRFDMLFMDIEVLNTEEGKNLRALLEAECSVGTSIRGVGDMEGKYVKNYEILGIDFVGNPSSSTFTRMPISESVKLEMKDERALKEMFNVTTSSTNVVRDLDQAANIQQQLEGIGYGTVTKTSTKVDQETDPKTGAQTSITTLEAETSDEVSDLDQALYMAKNAMLNGVVHVDSITIENIDEEKNESVGQATYKSTPVLKEDDEEERPYHYEKRLTKTLEIDCAPGGIRPGEVLERVSEGTKLQPKEPNGMAFGNWIWHYDEMDDESWEEAKKIIFPRLKEAYEQGVIRYAHMAIDDDLVKVYDDEQPKESMDYVPEKTALKEKPTVTEAKKEEDDPNLGKKFVLHTDRGFVTFDKNAIDFTEKPEDALHFTEGKEESGMVSMSKVTEILDAMGIFEVEKYFQRSKVNLSAKEPTENEQKEGLVGKNENATDTSLNEENGTNTRFLAKVTLDTKSGTTTEEIPVSGVEKDAIKNEVGNLYNMKAQANDVNNVSIQVVDTVSSKSYSFDPQSQKFTPIETQMEEALNKPFEDDKTITRDDDTLSVEVDDGIVVSKKFDTPLQADVAKTGIEQGEIDSELLYKEDAEDFEEPVECIFCKETFEKADCKKEKDLGYLCDQCIRAIEAKEGDILEFEEDVMDEKLFQQATQPSDEFTTTSLQEENTDVLVTLKNIRYDFDQILNDVDLDEPGEVQDLIDALPDPWTVRLHDIDLAAADNFDQLHQIVIEKANAQLPWGIFDANIEKVEEADTGLMIYDANWKEHTPTVEENALEKVYMETDKFVVTQDILDVLKSVTDKAVLKLVDQYENGLINGFTLLSKALEELENQ